MKKLRLMASIDKIAIVWSVGIVVIAIGMISMIAVNHTEENVGGYMGTVGTLGEGLELANERINEKNISNSIKEASFNLIIKKTTESYDGKNCNLSKDPKNCFVDSFENCTNAIYSKLSHTIEGDPILSIRKINSANQTSCSVYFFVDTTADNYGVGERVNLICQEVYLDEDFNYLRMNQCTN